MANTSISLSSPVSEKVICSRWRHWWRLSNALALDAALIGVCWQALVAKSLEVELGISHGFLLGAAIWLGYVADRLLDGVLMGSRACTQRHLLAVRYRTSFLFAWMLVFIASLFFAFETLSSEEISVGLFLAGLCVANAFLAQLDKTARFPLPKELRTALLYSVGIFFFVFCNLQEALFSFWVIFATVTTICFLNCCFIAHWEREVDLRQGQSSLALRLDCDSGYLCVGAFTFFWFCLLAFFLFPERNLSPLFLVAGCATSFLPWLDSLPIEIEDKRILADWGLLVPCSVVLALM